MTLRIHPDAIVETSSSALLGVHPSWGRVRLGEIAEVLNGFAFKSEFFSQERGLPLLRIRDVGRAVTDARYFGDYDPRYVVHEGDIVVGMDGDFRVARWLGSPALLNQRVCRLIVRDPEVYAPSFLLYALPGYLNAIHSHTSSITVKHLSSRTVEQIPLPLPPINEQRRIASAIDEQFSRLEAADQSLVLARRKLAALGDAAVADVFSGDWPWTVLGAIAEIAGGVTKDAKRQTDPSFVEVPYLRVANVQRGYLNLSDVARIRVPEAKSRTLALQPGDVLFNEGGDRDKLGRGWVWSGEIEGCIHQNHVFRARLCADFEPKFVSWHGNTFGRRWFEANGRQTTNLASLNLTTLKAFPVPAPPRDVQRRLVVELEQQLTGRQAVDDAIEKATHRSVGLRRSILERAFQGGLAPQDVDDEPASDLLQRIVGARPEPTPSRRRKVTT